MQNQGSGCHQTQEKPNYLPAPFLLALPPIPYKVVKAVEHRGNSGLHFILVLASPTLAIRPMKELLVSTP